MKDTNDMFRLVIITAAFLVMFLIIGVSLHSVKSANTANQINKDKKEGEHIASIIAQTTATTSIWDYLRDKETTTQTVTTDSLTTDVSGEELPAEENTSAEEVPTEEAPAPENDAPTTLRITID